MNKYLQNLIEAATRANNAQLALSLKITLWNYRKQVIKSEIVHQIQSLDPAKVAVAIANNLQRVA